MSSVRPRVLAVALIAGSIASASPQVDPDQPIDLELEGAPLVEILRSFAGISGSRLDLDPEVDGLVTLELKNVPWRQALKRVCADHRLDCQLLAGEPPVLRVRPLDSDRSAGASGGDRTESAPAVAGDRRLAVRFLAPGGGRSIEESVRFSWAAPVRTVDAGEGADGERWQARLSWIPFGPELELIVPTLVRCAGDGVESEALEPLRLPLEAPATRSWRGARLELSTVPADAATTTGGAAATGAAKPGCGDGDRDGIIRASFRRAGAGAGETTLDLAASPGTYLLVTPPAGDGRPAAAVLAAGDSVEGERRVAVLRPTAGGFAISRHVLPAGGEVSQRLPVSGGELELRLRSADSDD